MDEHNHHRRATARMYARGLLFIAAPAIAVSVVSCSSSEYRVVLGNDLSGDASPPSLAPVMDAAPEATSLTAYCPSDQCPEGYTTCLDSRFACDVDLRVDPNNCGACGSKCPSEPGKTLFSCVEGRCVPTCVGEWADCDGIPDNGCETDVWANNDACGACGVTCPDPSKPCITNPLTTKNTCGCAPNEMICYILDDPPRFPTCVNGADDDKNCGACKHACNPNGPEVDGGPAVRPPHTYYGCRKGECDALKCETGWADCDLDVPLLGTASNGCETQLGTAENCLGCGDVCPSGQACRGIQQSLTITFQCACQPGETFCSIAGNVGSCADLSNDPENCGACGNVCPTSPNLHAFGSCSYGECTLKCDDGRADCNGSPADGCETDISSDPRNCGGCGVICDGIAGQACAGGRCVMAPCDSGDGGPVAR